MRRARAGLVTICVAVCAGLVVLAAAGAMLFATGIVPLSGLEGRIARAIEERLGPGWTVEAATAELGRVDGRSQLRVRQVAFRHAGGAVIRAPEAVLGYQPWALIRGEIRLVSVDLRGVNVRLGVTREGALLVNADSAPAVPLAAAALPDAGQWDVFTGVMTAVSTLAQGDGMLGGLESVGINGARLALIDPEGAQKAGLDDVDIRLSRVRDGVTQLSLRGRTGQRVKQAAVELSTDPDGTRRAVLDLQRFEPAEAVALTFGTGSLAIEGMPMQGKAVLTQKPDGQRHIGAEIAIAAGMVKLNGGPVSQLAVDAIRLSVESGRDLNELIVRSASFQAGKTQLDLAGTVTARGTAWELDLTGQGALAGLEQDPPVAFDAIAARMTLDPAARSATIAHAALKGPLIDAEMTGTFRQVGDSPEQRFAIRARGTDARAALAVWPRWTSPELHTTLSDQLAAGRLGELTVELDLSAADHARLVQGGGLPDGALRVAVAAEKIRFLPAKGLPFLVDATAKARASGRSVEVTVPRAAVELGDGRQLALSEGSFAIPDTWQARAPARAAFRTKGSVDSLLALLAFPALREVAPVGIDPKGLRGASELKTAVGLVLAEDPKPGEIVVQSSGTLTGLASDTLFGTEKLEAGTLAIAVDAGGLVARGEARVGGDRAQIDIRQNARGQGEATLQMTLDNAARQRRGIGTELGVTGPVQVKASKALGRAAEAPARVEIDLGRAAIDSALPGLAKPAGRAGRLAFSYVPSPDGADLEDLTLEASPVLIRGRVELDRQNGLELASLSQFRLSSGDNLKAEIRRDGNLMRYAVKGAVADTRPFIRAMQGGGGKRGNKAAKGGDFDLDLDVPILTGFGNEAISNGVLKMSRRGGELRSLAFQGRIGSGEISARQGADGAALVVQSQNGGGMLRFLDLYRRAHGGDLTLTLAPGERQKGELLFRNFSVRDEPALRRVVAPQAYSDLSSDRTGGGAALRAELNEVGFTKLRAEFVRSASRLDLTDMVIWGQQIGFTIQGHVDYGRDRVDIGGTFVPGYAFNNAFAQVPVLGAILGGGSQYGGLFAVNFRITGAASAPTMSINPLSAIAPGILRRFVDPLGGTNNPAPPQR